MILSWSSLKTNFPPLTHYIYTHTDTLTHIHAYNSLTHSPIHSIHTHLCSLIWSSATLPPLSPLSPVPSSDRMACFIGIRFAVLRQESISLGETDSEDYSDPPPLDPVKAYFKLLQCIHHLEILNKCLADNTCPIGMKRKVDKLASFIKPASPDFLITAMIAAHTKSWMMDNVMALRNNNSDLSETLINDLGPFQPSTRSNGPGLDTAENSPPPS